MPGYSGKGVTVTILDDGVEWNHPDLSRFIVISIIIVTKTIFDDIIFIIIDCVDIILCTASSDIPDIRLLAFIKNYWESLLQLSVMSGIQITSRRI